MTYAIIPPLLPRCGVHGVGPAAGSSSIRFIVSESEGGGACVSVSEGGQVSVARLRARVTIVCRFKASSCFCCLCCSCGDSDMTVDTILVLGLQCVWQPTCPMIQAQHQQAHPAALSTENSW